MYSPAIGAEEILSHRGETELLNVCETTCLGTGAGGRKLVIVFEWALSKTLVMYVLQVKFNFR